MNGRMYDATTGRMISPDNYVPIPWNTQGYNRFSYANNNPLVYVDPDGEFFWLLVPIIIGAALNVYDNWDAVTNSFQQGFWNGMGHALGYAAVGAVQGITTTYLAPVSPILAGVANNIIGSVGNGILSGQSAENILINTAKGVGTGIASGALSGGLSGTLGKITTKSPIKSPTKL